MTSSNWDWYGADEKESLVVPQVEAVAVYVNSENELVIRQRSPMGEEDSVIVVPMFFAKELLRAIENQMPTQ